MIEGLLASAAKVFNNRYKDSTTEWRFAKDEPPVTGLIVDNPLLEYILDRRFLAYGRFYLAYGAKGASKTSLFFDFTKLFQRNDGDVIWIETEHAADIDYAAKQGVDISRLGLIHPPSLEEGLIVAETLIRELPKRDPESKTPLLICFDSIAGAVAEAESDKQNDIRDVTVGVHARLLSKFYREMEGPLANEKCVFLALNQLRESIGRAGPTPESNDTMIGGKAAGFHSTYQFKMAYTGTLKSKDAHGAERKIGSKHSITCKRNKLGREGNMQKIDFDMYINGGIDWWSPLVRMLGENYKSLVSSAGARHTWKTPGIMYQSPIIDEKTKEITGYEEKEIPTDDELLARDLAVMIANSTPAKELIRTVFGIPALPSAAEVAEVEKDKLTKRKKKKRLSDDVENDIN